MRRSQRGGGARRKDGVPRLRSRSMGFGRWIVAALVATLVLSVGTLGPTLIAGSEEASAGAGNRLRVEVTGSGRVSSNPSGIADCRASSGDCEQDFAPNDDVQLTATPDSGQQFQSWSACPNANGNICNIDMPNRDLDVTASFSGPSPSASPSPQPSATPSPQPSASPTPGPSTRATFSVRAVRRQSVRRKSYLSKRARAAVLNRASKDDPALARLRFAATRADAEPRIVRRTLRVVP